MDAGKFDRRITLQRKVEADDGYATSVASWSDIATVWAQLLPLSAIERAAAGETASFAKKSFRIRRDSSWSDLNATDRVVYDSVNHDLTAVREDGRAFYILDCVARGE